MQNFDYFINNESCDENIIEPLNKLKLDEPNRAFLEPIVDIDGTPKHNETLTMQQCLDSLESVFLDPFLLNFNFNDAFVQLQNDLPNYNEETLALTEMKTNGKKTPKNNAVHNHKPYKALYKCDKCPYKTVKKPYFKAHNIQKHSGYLTFVCDVCGYDARYNSTLQIHKLDHTKDS